MGRFRNRRSHQGFRVSDLLRLMSMVGMLCVVGMVMLRARDESMWRWVISDSRPSNGPPEVVLAAAQATARPSVVAAQPKKQAAAAKADEDKKPESPDNTEKATAENTFEPAADPAPEAKARPSHLDPVEWQQAEYEFQLVEDKSILEHFDMPAYWRMLNWAQSQSIKELAQRSDQDATFTDFVQRPGKMRGKLCRLKLHMLQSKRYEAGPNRYGFKWLYEVWGYTNDSNPYPYVIVFADWPKGMPLGANLAEEATVDAYFLKLMKYEAHDGKMRMSPLLVGKLVWHPNPLREARASSNSMEQFWLIFYVAGAAALALLGYKVYGVVSGRTNSAAPLATTNTSYTETWTGDDGDPEIPAFLRDGYQADSAEAGEESGREQAQ